MRLVKLNVGGVLFATSRSTLESCTYFQRLLSAEFSDLDSNGEAFIDRDGRYFHLVLNFLRSGAVELPPPPLTAEAAISEAEFFGIDALAEALRRRISPDATADGEGVDGSTPAPMLRADGTGLYVWEDRQQPGLLEAVSFEAEASDADDGEPETALGRGKLIYSRGPCARENILAMRTMPTPLPRIWRDSADASTTVAFFTTRFISRGKWELDGSTLLLQRGTLGSDATGPDAQAQSMVTTVGVLLSRSELLLLGLDSETPSAASNASLLEQLGLQSWREAGLVGTVPPAIPEKNAGGLGGGFKRFVWEPHATRHTARVPPTPVA